MTLTELVETHNLDLSVKYSNYTGKWYCSIDYVDIKKGSFLHGSVGEHCKTIVDAIESCVKTIKGQVLVYRATSKEHRKEIKVPNSLKVS